MTALTPTQTWLLDHIRSIGPMSELQIKADMAVVKRCGVELDESRLFRDLEVLREAGLVVKGESGWDRTVVKETKVLQGSLFE